MAISLANGHYFPTETDVPVGRINTQTLHDKDGGSGLLHANLGGVAPNEVTYITNEFMPDATQNPGNVFKVDSLPDGFSNVIVRGRWKWSARLDPQHFTIALYQGKPSTGASLILKLDWSGADSFSELGYVLGTWNDLFLPVDESLITDRTDLWFLVDMDRHPNQGVANPDRAVEQLSWLVLQCDFPFSTVGEAPTGINNVNGLAKVVVALSNVGDDGQFRYCYRVVPIGASGSGPSDEVSIETGPSALDSTDKICLTWPDITGATSYKVYRTCSPSSASLGTGLIATVSLNQGACGGGGGGSETGLEDDGTECITDCDEQFSEDSCEEPTTITY